MSKPKLFRDLNGARVAPQSTRIILALGALHINPVDSARDCVRSRVRGSAVKAAGSIWIAAVMGLVLIRSHRIFAYEYATKKTTPTHRQTCSVISVCVLPRKAAADADELPLPCLSIAVASRLKRKGLIIRFLFYN